MRLIFCLTLSDSGSSDCFMGSGKKKKRFLTVTILMDTTFWINWTRRSRMTLFRLSTPFLFRLEVFSALPVECQPLFTFHLSQTRGTSTLLLLSVETSDLIPSKCWIPFSPRAQHKAGFIVDILPEIPAWKTRTVPTKWNGISVEEQW